MFLDFDLVTYLGADLYVVRRGLDMARCGVVVRTGIVAVFLTVDVEDSRCLLRHRPNEITMRSLDEIVSTGFIANFLLLIDRVVSFVLTMERVVGHVVGVLWDDLRTVEIAVVFVRLIAGPLERTGTAPTVDTTAMGLIEEGGGIVDAPVPVINLRPTEALGRAAPVNLAYVVLRISFGCLLLINVALSVRIINVLLAEGGDVLTQICGLFGNGFDLIVLFNGRVDLSNGDVYGTLNCLRYSVLIVLAFALVRVINDVLAFLHGPLCRLFIVREVLEVLVTVGELYEDVRGVDCR